MRMTTRFNLDDFLFGVVLAVALLDALGLCAVVLYGELHERRGGIIDAGPTPMAMPMTLFAEAARTP